MITLTTTLLSVMGVAIVFTALRPLVLWPLVISVGAVMIGAYLGALLS